MLWVHKERERHFLLGELHPASVSQLVDDHTDEIIGIMAAAKTNMYDSSSRNFFTSNGGATFHAVSWDLGINGISLVVNEDAEADATKVASLRLALQKFLEAA